MQSEMLVDVWHFIVFYVDEDAIHLLHKSSIFPEIKPCIGIHPWKVQTESLEKMLRLIREEKGRIVGIGEIGLDCAKHLLEGDPVRSKWYYK